MYSNEIIKLQLYRPVITASIKKSLKSSRMHHVRHFPIKKLLLHNIELTINKIRRP